MGQLTVIQQFFINTDLFRDAQAIRHFDDIDTVKERLVVFVITEGYPLGFVGVREDNAVERQGGDPLGTVIVAFLGRRQQWVQYLNRRFKHLDEFHDPLVGAAQRAGVTIGIRVVLRIVFQFADIHFPHQRRNVLVIFITGFRFGDGNLFED